MENSIIKVNKQEKLNVYGTFEFHAFPGSYDNNKYAILVKNGIDMRLHTLDGWNISKNVPGATYFLAETLPSSKFINETTKLIKKVQSEMKISDYENLLDNWRKSILNFKTVPRFIHIVKSNVEKPRSKKKQLFIKCGFDDIFLKETIRTMGFSWNINEKAFQLEAQQEKITEVLLALSSWKGCPDKRRVDDSELDSAYPMLRSSQKEAMSFLMERMNKGMHGAIVADDMGSGKTMTSLAFIAACLEQGLVERGVVFAPIATIDEDNDGWRGQSERLPILEKAFVFTAANMGRVKYKDPEYVKECLSGAKLVVTNYEFVNKSPERLKTILETCKNSVVVFDEATKCNNRVKPMFKNAFLASTSGRFSIVLSGTPIVNDIGDMHTLFALADPSIYPYHEFFKNHVELKKIKVWNQTLKKEITREIEEYHGEEEFRDKVRSHFIRRRTEEVVPVLPEKFMHMEIVEEKDAEREFICANTVEECIMSRFKKSFNLKEVAARYTEEEVNPPKWQLDGILHSQACLDDPYILTKSPFADDKEHLVYEILSSLEAKGIDPRNPDIISAKIKRLITILNNHPDSKVMIFTSFKRMAARLCEILSKHPDTQNREISSIVGGMAKTVRKKQRSDFKESPNGILVCTDTLAYGANCQYAGVLINYGMPIKPEPATLNQRNARIYRGSHNPEDLLGEKHIYYLISEHPVEKRWLGIIQRKDSISKSVIDR